METIYRTCALCKGVNHTPEYKLKASNFSNLTVNLIKTDVNTPNIPMPIGATPQGIYKYFNSVVCNECVELAGGPVSTVIAIMETAKANDLEIKAVLNS